MKTAAATALAALVTVSYTENSAAFLAGGGAFLGQNAHHARLSRNAASYTTSSMSLVDADKAVADAAQTLVTFLAGATVMFAGGEAALADGATQRFSLPPVSQAKDRCVFKSSAMGQANAARDSLYDLRECNLR